MEAREVIVVKGAADILSVATRCHNPLRQGKREEEKGRGRGGGEGEGWGGNHRFAPADSERSLLLGCIGQCLSGRVGLRARVG